jgi:hypothetical protein
VFNFIRWFQPASDVIPNLNPWHAYRESGADALCGEARITYNLDGVADAVPDSGVAHPGCLAVVSGRPPLAPIETATKRGRPRKAK